MRKHLKKRYLLFLLLLLLIPFLVWLGSISTGHTKPVTSKEVAAVHITPSATPTPTTEPENTPEVTDNPPFYYMSIGAPKIDCTGPDGKTFKATKSDCDAFITYWNDHPKPKAPDNPVNNPGGGSGGNNNNGGSTPTATPTPTPTSAPVVNQPVIDTVNVKPCTSSSCSFITSIEVIGKNLEQGIKMALLQNGIRYDESTTNNNNPDATQTGANPTTQLMYDFYHLPGCSTFDVMVYYTQPDTRSATKSAAFSTICNR